MNVTDATPRVAGRALRDIQDWAWASGRRIRAFARHPVAEFQRNAEQFGYPANMVALIDIVLLAVAVLAVIQRCVHGYSILLPLLALTLAYSSGPLCAFFGIMPKPLLIAALTMSAEALFLSQPVPTDASPFVLIAAAGEIAALAPMIASIPVALAMIAELMFFSSIGHLDIGMPIWFFAVACGWMTGQMLNFQRRYLYQEREYQEVRAVAAADEERRRIAREVHDVIAHSLSITLLHVTAARHALQTDRDVDDAVEALTDAERLGRQAMADIRRTVGLLDQRPTSQSPEPGLEDIADLVADFVRAGMAVEFGLEGDPSNISASVGLALYRISQESLANIAKHAPGAPADLRIMLCSKDITVDVRNSLPAGAAARPGRGMGISGMRQRISLLGGTLSAGPHDDGWRVQARIPMSGQLTCMAVGAEDSLRGALQSMARKLHDRPNPMVAKDIQEDARDIAAG
ncbi:histidine kinase [Nocardia sp. NBC_01503]|uniref:sensor histidine kinase n=1 Tax=Nocardia sp. NBC_01503 TaxID=2975997 RepID=UPI002E7AE4D4|nr:histidine kinase [Nocardia sp. NBC_01503]WTL32971.1 histidine kinase [Nocardia sp. NBC_01503]